MSAPGAGSAPARRRGLAAAVLGAYPRFRASMAAQLAERPPESRLLAYAMGACLALFLGRLAQLLHAPAGSLQGGLGAQVGAAMLALLFFLPLVLYAVAALTQLGARAFGGAGGWYETRLATFWALLVAAPAQLGATLVGDLLRMAGAGWAATALGAAAWALTAWIWASCVAQAHGFRSAAAVFAGLFVLVNGAALAFMTLAALTGGA
ncbi:hypothetical protein [Oceanicella actignis]|uniref:Yip1 domain-containing protein n=1 Tax=Oceanicella actignis TaxID=1189325 RepID=A0A1M7TGZ9_9RHOB|nr:hypothetical protein [Oceanicella actignis]TYO88485.1 hypothetical protein LY05_02145 [Oceanicella actignis]SET59690.1 hypothetical protein SAMN04488119_10667 [Oceanicella actignis]SHN69923.1 hypothetical protein SAMN05216200_106136 [Oceanicella actignis]